MLARSLSNFLRFSSYSQCNKILNNSDKLLDLVISNKLINVYRSDFIIVDKDDHHPALSFDFNNKTINKKHFHPKARTAFNLRRANMLNLNKPLLNIDWTFLGNCENINSACDYFYNTLEKAFVSHVPFSTAQSQCYPLWFSFKIITLIKGKYKAFCMYEKTSLANRLFKIYYFKVKGEKKNQS